MQIRNRLSAVYDVSDLLVHQYRATDFGGKVFGNLVRMKEGRTTGYELVESIRIAEEHVNEIQYAIINMLNILEKAEPVEDTK